MSLQSRIAEKRSELASLQQIQRLSDDLCSQLEQLETKLETLSDGTEGLIAVSLVMSNWNDIIKSVSLASMSLANYADTDYENKEDPPLPETLVRLRISDDSL